VKEINTKSISLNCVAKELEVSFFIYKSEAARLLLLDVQRQKNKSTCAEYDISLGFQDI